jgi:hypothetical protein
MKLNAIDFRKNLEENRKKKSKLMRVFYICNSLWKYQQIEEIGI